MSEPIRKDQRVSSNDINNIQKIRCILCNKKLDNNEMHKCVTRTTSQSVRIYLN